MSIQEIQDLIVTILAPIGGVAGVIAIITAIVKIIVAGKNSKSLSQYSQTLEGLKGDIISEMQNKLNCSLDVDISAKLNDVLENVENKYLKKARDIDDKLNVMRELNVEMAKLMSTSRKITEDKRVELGALIDRCAGLITAPEEETKPKLRIELKPDEAVRETVEEIEQTELTKRRHITV